MALKTVHRNTIMAASKAKPSVKAKKKVFDPMDSAAAAFALT